MIAATAGNGQISCRSLDDHARLRPVAASNCEVRIAVLSDQVCKSDLVVLGQDRLFARRFEELPERVNGVVGRDGAGFGGVSDSEVAV